MTIERGLQLIPPEAWVYAPILPGNVTGRFNVQIHRGLKVEHRTFRIRRPEMMRLLQLHQVRRRLLGV